MPGIPTVGVVAVTSDSWNGLPTTRHLLLSELAQFFQVTWLEPSSHWRRMAPFGRVLSPHRRRIEARYVKTSGTSGVTKCQPLAWLPDFYRPAKVRSAVRAKRYERAARSLRNSGCDKVLLHVWRPDFVDALDSRDYFDGVIYHIDDDYSFADDIAPISPAERRLLEEADAVILHSPGLAERKGRLNKRTHAVPNGVDFDLYSRSCVPPRDLMAIPAPRIGYAGVIRSQLDIPLMRRLAERRQDWSFVLVGPLGHLAGYESEMAAMSELPNVHLMGYRPARELPAYQQHFDVCMMPYRTTAYTHCIYPLKLHEYLAGGKPVVGTPIRTLLDFSHVVSLASGIEQWMKEIQSCLAASANEPEKVASRRAVAADHDWSVLAERTALIMASVLDTETQRRVMALVESLPTAGGNSAIGHR